MSVEPKQDPFQLQQHQAAPVYSPPGQGQYTGVVYNNNGQQQQYPQHPDYYQQPTPGALTHQNTLASTHSAGINPIPTPIQPDPLPKAHTQVQVETSVAQMYPGATMEYVPRLTAPDEFHHGLCGCISDFFKCRAMSTCCCGMWCPCILYSRIHYRLRARNPHDLNGFSSCNGQCWSSVCLGTAVHSRQRDEIRHRYRLSGSCCGDCFRHTCCGPCTLCQEEKEVIYREEELENLVKAGNYQSSQQMMYPGQTKTVVTLK